MSPVSLKIAKRHIDRVPGYLANGQRRMAHIALTSAADALGHHIRDNLCQCEHASHGEKTTDLGCERLAATSVTTIFGTFKVCDYCDATHLVPTDYREKGQA